jgi:hypothetical protein
VIALPKLSLRHEKRWHVQSDFAGYAAYGYYGSHSRYFWGIRPYLLRASDGMPIAF